MERDTLHTRKCEFLYPKFFKIPEKSITRAPKTHKKMKTSGIAIMKTHQNNKKKPRDFKNQTTSRKLKDMQDWPQKKERNEKTFGNLVSLR